MLTKYLINRLGGCHTPAFTEKACLNSRGRKELCTRCAMVCASEAVTVRRGKRVMDADACDGCGVCVSVCPSLALSCEKPDYHKALEELRGKEEILLVCREHIPAGIGEGPVLPCLGGIPWEFLAALSLQARGRTINLVISDCAACFRRKNLWALFAAIKKARSFVEMAGCQFSLETSTGETLRKNREDPGLTRREVFSELAVVIRKEALGFFPGMPGKGGREGLRRRLQGYEVKGRRPLSPGELPFMNWQVKRDCQACGLCQGVCPREAWSLKKEEGLAVLSHSPWECTSCGLCRSLCPGQALSPSLWGALPPRGAQVKKTFPLQVCRICKSSSVPEGKEGLCLPCRKREQVKAALTKQREKARAAAEAGLTPKGWKEGA